MVVVQDYITKTIKNVPKFSLAPEHMSKLGKKEEKNALWGKKKDER